MKDALIISVLSVFPRKRGARAMGWLARTRASRLVTRLFVKAYGVDLSQATRPIADYHSLEALFTRQLVEGARPVDLGTNGLCSPVDGTVAAIGTTVNQQIALTEKQTLSIPALLNQRVEGERDVVVLYLSPTDYHRVHSPTDGSVQRWEYLPGTLWPVFPTAVRRVKGLFSRNERLVFELKTAKDTLHLVMIGAFGVGRMSSPVCGILTNTRSCAARTEASDYSLDAGDLIGVFHLGSTVALIAPPGRLRWSISHGQHVQCGQHLANRNSP